MKINKKIDGYNVKSLEGIKSGVNKMRRHCDTLDDFGRIILNNIRVARSEGFDDVNCDRAEEIINEYRRTLANTKYEFDELNDSIKQFIETISDYWSSWR